MHRFILPAILFLGLACKTAPAYDRNASSEKRCADIITAYCQKSIECSPELASFLPESCAMLTQECAFVARVPPAEQVYEHCIPAIQEATCQSHFNDAFPAACL